MTTLERRVVGFLFVGFAIGYYLMEAVRGVCS